MRIMSLSRKEALKYMRAQQAILLTTAMPSKRVIQHSIEYDNVPAEDQEVFAMMSDVERKQYLENLTNVGRGDEGEDQGGGIPGPATPLKRSGTSGRRQPQKSKKTRIMQGEQVAGDTTALEAFLEEAGCLDKERPGKKQSFHTAQSEESDFDVEEEFPSRRVAAAKARRGRGVAKATQPAGGRGRGGG